MGVSSFGITSGVEVQALLMANPQIEGYVAWAGRVGWRRHEWAIIRGDGSGDVVASGVERSEGLASAAAHGALCAMEPDRLPKPAQTK